MSQSQVFNTEPQIQALRLTIVHVIKCLYVGMYVIRVGIITIFAPFNFVVICGSQNKGHTNIKGFTVLLLPLAWEWSIGMGVLVYLHISGITCSNFTLFSVHINCDHSLVL